MEERDRSGFCCLICLKSHDLGADSTCAFLSRHAGAFHGGALPLSSDLQPICHRRGAKVRAAKRRMAGDEAHCPLPPGRGKWIRSCVRIDAAAAGAPRLTAGGVPFFGADRKDCCEGTVTARRGALARPAAIGRWGAPERSGAGARTSGVRLERLRRAWVCDFSRAHKDP